MMNQHTPIITIDGPSGTGKGTIAQQLAMRLQWHFLDSGAIYRVLAYAAVQQNFEETQVDALVRLAHALDLRFVVNEATNQVLLDQRDITQDIRTEHCGQMASKIAVIPQVREALLARQRAFAQWPGLITDGRDMGTVVFPQADLKIFLDASVEERARRRYFQLKEKGDVVSLTEVISELEKRDARDRERTVAPLKPASDAIVIDTTDMSIVQVFANVLQLANAIG
jgi:cytidylate kinase